MRMFMVFLGIMATKLVALPSDVHVKRSVNDHTIEYTMSQIPEQPNPEKKFRILGRDEKDANQILCAENSGRINDLVRTYSITPTGEHTDSLQKFSTPSNRLTRVMSEGLPGKHVKRGLHYKHFLGRPHWKHGPPHHHHRVIFSPTPLGPPTTSSSPSPSPSREFPAPRQTVVRFGARLGLS
ncbi:BgTH12-06741 [Blumeria graminis f. sp. triticale]|uniref:BgTH12-06741 n=1 Tax=Blumeria graminis f. sp. triticale TaxID=1689686 RepID=A0A9W4DJS8_BLUGR|nr:BgTH12-06741 [Blumeria graminis f. sp. triticale]